VVAFAVVLLLAGPVASVHAAGFGQPVTGGIGISSGVAGLWEWIKTAFSAGAVVQTACDKGSSIDPDGGCRAAAASPAGSAGANGTTADSDAGGYIDPNGG
ncbi:MAG TPA: hypothetical protein VGK45_17630, partial [Thermoanaerobaculia bacterium]